MPSDSNYLALGKWTGRPIGKIVHHHQRPNETAHRLRTWRDVQPFVEGATLIGLEVAEADPTQPRRIDNGRHGIEGRRKHFLQPRMHQERLFVFDEKLIELNAELGVKRGDPIALRPISVTVLCISSLHQTLEASRIADFI